MRGAGLQGFSVLHHGFNAVSIEGAGEAFGLGLVADDHRHGHELAGELRVHVHHLRRLGHGLVVGGVGRMAFLPQELGGTQEQARAHLPAYDVRPLVAQDRKVAPRLDPVLVGIPDDGLGGRAHDQFLFQLRIGIDHHALAVGRHLKAVVRNHGAFLGEPFHMLGFPAQERFGDEQREIGVHVSRFLEHLVKLVLHLLPDGIAIGLDDHAAADSRLLGQIGLHHQIVVPL